jgi:methionine-rich copper-binding protein CopC
MPLRQGRETGVPGMKMWGGRRSATRSLKSNRSGTSVIRKDANMPRLIPFSFVLVLSLVASSAAFAHAYVKTAIPAKNSTVGSPPSEIVIDFTEGIEPKYSSIEVHDSTGARVDTGDVHGIKGNNKRLIVGLKPLTPGTYEVIWRATSTDTHKTSGRYPFTVAP